MLINFILQGFAKYIESEEHNHSPVKDLFVIAQIRAVMKPLVETDTTTAVEVLVKKYCEERGYVFYFSLLYTHKNTRYLLKFYTSSCDR